MARVDLAALVSAPPDLQRLAARLDETDRQDLRAFGQCATDRLGELCGRAQSLFELRRDGDLVGLLGRRGRTVWAVFAEDLHEPAAWPLWRSVLATWHGQVGYQSLYAVSPCASRRSWVWLRRLGFVERDRLRPAHRLMEACC